MHQHVMIRITRDFYHSVNSEGAGQFQPPISLALPSICIQSSAPDPRISLNALYSLLEIGSGFNNPRKTYRVLHALTCMFLVLVHDKG